MSADEVVKLIDSASKLLGVLVWPALLAFVLVRFGPALKDFFANLGEFSLKGGGLEATAKRNRPKPPRRSSLLRLQRRMRRQHPNPRFATRTKPLRWWPKRSIGA